MPDTAIPVDSAPLTRRTGVRSDLYESEMILKGSLFLSYVQMILAHFAAARTADPSMFTLWGVLSPIAGRETRISSGPSGGKG
jgi:hypothetical protein